jgi:hypothetical protein
MVSDSTKELCGSRIGYWNDRQLWEFVDSIPCSLLDLASLKLTVFSIYQALDRPQPATLSSLP